MRELASALEYLHSSDAISGGIMVCHRDVKPDNLGITHAGRLKLLDFGLAVALKKGETESDVYELTGGTVSRRYMAPEVFREEPYGVAVDVYSWAVVACEVWSLRGKPYAGYSLDTHAERVVGAGERPPLPHAWSADVKELLSDAWADPQERCSAGHAVGVLTRLEVMGGSDPLATGSCCAVA